MVVTYLLYMNGCIYWRRYCDHLPWFCRTPFVRFDWWKERQARLSKWKPQSVWHQNKQPIADWTWKNCVEPTLFPWSTICHWFEVVRAATWLGVWITVYAFYFSDWRHPSHACVYFIYDWSPVNAASMQLDNIFSLKLFLTVSEHVLWILSWLSNEHKDEQGLCIPLGIFMTLTKLWSSPVMAWICVISPTIVWQLVNPGYFPEFMEFSIGHKWSNQLTNLN